MLTEAELQKQWESLTFTDDFIFSRVMLKKTLPKPHHKKHPQSRSPATFTHRGSWGQAAPKRCWGSRSKHAVRSFQRRGGFRRGKRRDIAAS